MRPHLYVVADPLPECAMCARPTKRDVHATLGGLCSDCHAQVERIAASVQPRLPLAPDELEGRRDA